MYATHCTDLTTEGARLQVPALRMRLINNRGFGGEAPERHVGGRVGRNRVRSAMAGEEGWTQAALAAIRSPI